MNTPWHRVTIAPGQVTLDGKTAPLAEPLRAEDFAADWFTLWLAANPDPHLPDAAIRQAQETVTVEWLRDLGQRLFVRAFPDEVADRLQADDVPLGSAQGKPLVLSFDEPIPSPSSPPGLGGTEGGLSLADLPWELLCDGGGFLARTRGVVRMLQPSPLPPHPPSPSPNFGRGGGGCRGEGVRALVALASPLLTPDLDPDDPRQMAIFDLEREADLFRGLEGAPFPAHFDLLPHATPAGLDAALRGCDVFHFVGHGNVSVLALENRDGTAHPVPTGWLRECFSVHPSTGSGHGPPRLALFTSCLTGAAPGGATSVAQTLLEAGVPLVVAMLQSISDRAARAFYRRLYAELGAGVPLHQAVAAARRAVADEPVVFLPDDEIGFPRPWEWATPALFARPEALEQPDLWTFPAGEGPATVSEPQKPNLPPLVPRPRPFVGRRAELVRVARGIDPDGGVPLTLLHGEGGMGKTALAAEAMYRWAGWFDRVLWLSARDVVPAATLAAQLADVPYQVALQEERPTDALFLQALGRALGLEIHGDEAAANLVTPILTALSPPNLAHPLFLILDNLETVAASPAVRQLLASLPRHARCLATSRHRLGVAANEVEVTGLYPREVAELLTRYAGAKGVLVSDEVATELYRRAGGHPMTLRLVVAQVKARAVTWGEALRGLADAGAETWREAFEYVFGRSLSAAGEEGRRAFALLALFTPFARREVWQAATGWDAAPFGQAVARLRDLSLVEDLVIAPLGTRDLGTHDLGTHDLGTHEGYPYYRLQELARAQAELLLRQVPEEDVAPARVRAAYVLADLARVANNNLTPGDERRAFAEQQARAAGRSVEEVEQALVQAALAAFDLERENLLAAVEWAFAAEEWDLVVPLATSQHEWQGIRSLWAEWERNDLRAVEAARRAGDRHGEGQTLGNLGNVYLQQGRWAEAIACYEQSLDVFRALGDRYGEGTTLMNLGSVYLQQGRWAEAIACYEQDLAICRDLGDRHGEGQTLTNLGVVYRQQGRWAEAIGCYEQDLAICRDLGDRYGEGQTLTNLGVVYRQQGRWAEAIACYEQSLEIKRDLVDRHGEGQTLTNLGNVYADQGRWAEAIVCHEQSLGIERALGDRHGEGQTLTNLGVVYRQQGRWAEAIVCYEQSLEIKRDLGDRQGEAQTLGNLVNVYIAQGEVGRAEQTVRQVYALFEQLGDYPNLITAGRLFADVLLRRGKADQAIAHYAQALLLALQIHPKPVVDTLQQILDAAKELARVGMLVEVEQLGAAGLQALQQVAQRGWQGPELEATGQVAHDLCATLALLGRSRGDAASPDYAQALEGARAVDASVPAEWGWNLEAWVGGLSTDWGTD